MGGACQLVAEKRRRVLFSLTLAICVFMCLRICVQVYFCNSVFVNWVGGARRLVEEESQIQDFADPAPPITLDTLLHRYHRHHHDYDCRYHCHDPRASTS